MNESIVKVEEQAEAMELHVGGTDPEGFTVEIAFPLGRKLHPAAIAACDALAEFLDANHAVRDVLLADGEIHLSFLPEDEIASTVAPRTFADDPARR